IPGVVGDIGGFGGLFSPDLSGMKEPILVSGTDGVGTKLKIAFTMDKHDTVGIDCVAMCVNDVICSGAKPLFFLDYIALGKNEPERVATVVKGVCDGCVQAGCALIGGETAEMPGFYPADEYDLAGFSVGIVDRQKVIEGQKLIQKDDALVAFASSGVHSNGFSLVRKIFKITPEVLSQQVDELNCTLGEALLTPTKIYVKPLLALAEKYPIHGVSHITGGGFYENIPRMLPKHLGAVIEKNKVHVLPIFNLIQQTGNIPEYDMFNTYNMGVGMLIALPSEYADAAISLAKSMGQDAYVVGEVKDGSGEVKLA
ncbi:MAG TPA: phosphoribosylformylglycinamidine cyclo-ligase, partial [Oscillospiraceae bacterium]|nr:phosphoribosylformylglycinamidine cyclo-ligase [Oscillospiraceae bacterium]